MAAANNLLYGAPRYTRQSNPLDDLLSQARAAQLEGKKANEERYADILKGYQDREKAGLDLLRGAGTQEEKDIRTQYGSLANSTMQNLAARGMLGTTIAPTMEAGIKRQETDAIARLRERLNQQLYGATTGLSGDILGFKERRTDTYPSLSEISNLAMQYGQGTGGGGSYVMPRLSNRTPIREFAPVVRPTNKGNAQLIREAAAAKQAAANRPATFSAFNPYSWLGASTGNSASSGNDLSYAPSGSKGQTVGGYYYPAYTKRYATGVE
jgi:hypothetical protein